MANMNLIVCDKEEGCKKQYGVLGDLATDKVAEFVNYQREYMENDCEVRGICSQICSVLEVKLDSVDIPGEIITGVKVSGTTHSGVKLNEAVGVAYIDTDGLFKTKIV
jgi:hypothetical protein